VSRSRGSKFQGPGGAGPAGPASSRGSSRPPLLEPAPRADDLIERAEALAPVLAERAEATEQHRQISAETLRDLEEAGLTQVLFPEPYGYLGVDFDTYFEIVVRLAEGCGSTGWCYSVAAVAGWHVGLTSPECQEEFFSTSPSPWTATASNPAHAQLVRVAGGWLLSGRWDFSSGCDHADWAMFGALEQLDTGPESRLVLVPRTDWRIEDTWYASGLEGTGSKDLVIDEPVFVPRHRLVPLRGTETSDARLIRPSYGVPLLTLMPTSVLAPLLGIATGARNVFEQRMRTRVSAVGAKPLATVASIQTRLAEASAEIDAATTLLRNDLREALRQGARGEFFTVDERLRLRRNQAYASTLCVRAVQRLFEASGAHALFRTNPLQRAHRDVNAGSHQIVLAWDEVAEAYGRVRLGLEPNTLYW
jgi:3-hydroxy-9,10-secoandrosta-1,3,5(10)-triene-9,17-dione monooxygenase